MQTQPNVQNTFVLTFNHNGFERSVSTNLYKYVLNFPKNRQNEIHFMAKGNSRFVLRASREITYLANSPKIERKKTATHL